MPLAYFLVRATVADAAKRWAFDEWYRKEHLLDAAKAFGVKKARRFRNLAGANRKKDRFECMENCGARFRSSRLRKARVCAC